METPREALVQIDQTKRRALYAGIAILAVCGIFGFMNPTQFIRSYLFAYVFWTGIVLGSMGITLLHHLSGGRWGAVVRSFLEAATRTLPFMALLFVPILLGMSKLYIWADESHMMADPILQQKEIYLNVPFFIFRTVLYFAVWYFLIYLLNRWSRLESEADIPELQKKFQLLGGVGLLLYGLTMTFASVDWMMSLEPHWFSTIYGLLVITGQVLSAFAFVIAAAALMIRYQPLAEVMGSMQFHDLGKLLLAFVMIWAYLAFSQFLIIWSGNLPEETPWYIHRLHHGWQWIGVFLIVFHFALPFLLLLSRSLKRNYRALAIVAVAVMVMRLVDLFWLIGPEFHTEGLAFHGLDLLLPLGIGGIWISLFLGQLKARPLIPTHDPNLKEVLEHGTA